MKQKAKRIFLGVIGVALLASGTISVLTPSLASAAAKDHLEYYNDDLYKELSAHQHYWWLYACFNNVDIDRVTRGEVDSWDFFQGNGSQAVIGGMYDKSSDTGFWRRCDDQNMVKTAFNYLGFTDSRDTFCSLPGAKYDNSTDDAVCLAGSGDGDWDNSDNNGNDIEAWYKQNVLPKKPTLNNAHLYMRAYTTFIQGCDIKFTEGTKTYDNIGDVPGVSTSSNRYAVPVIVKEGNNLVRKYKLGVGIDGTEPIPVVSNSEESGAGNAYTSKTCNQLVQEARTHAVAYAAHLNQVGYTENEDNPGGDTGDDGDEEFQSSCSIDGIGWIVCPVMNFIAGINDAAFGFLSSSFLAVDPELLTNSDTQAAWSGFRDVANALFVVAFLIILYSQMSGTAISNYGVKRMLPRLVIAAILVNMSYILCQLAVDVSNIVGSSVANLLGTSMPTASPDTATIENTDLPLWKDVTGGLLIAGTALVGIALLIAIGLPALLAFAMIVLILIARKAIMILLVVVAPVAFVAYLLPNTEQFFKKWWKLFSAMLFLYPIIGVVFGASLLAAKVINNTAGDDVLLQLTALGVIALPLFAVPLLLKGALAATGTLGTRIGNLSDRANKRAVGNIKQGRSGEAITAYKARKQSRQVRRRVGDGRIGKINQAIDKSRLGKYIGGNRGAALATSALFKEYSDEVDRQKDTMSDMSIHDKEKEDLFDVMKNKSYSSERRAAAASTIMARGGDQHVQEALDYLGTSDPEKDKSLGDIQKQVGYDIGQRKPFALGETDVSSLKNGTYNGGFQDKLGARIQAGKLGTGELASMGADELQRVSDLVSGADGGGGLTPTQHAQLSASIEEIYTNENITNPNDEKTRLLRSIQSKSVGHLKQKLVPLNPRTGTPPTSPPNTPPSP